MYKSIALLPLLTSSATAQTPGCHPQWRSGTSYTGGSLVSTTIYTTTTNSDGDEVTTSVKKNFECQTANAAHCPQYDPAVPAQQAGAWTDEGVCTGTAPPPVTSIPTTSPTHPIWSGAGCPEEWVEGAEYDNGELALVDGIVYRCSEEQFVNGWCGNGGYKPGDSQHWETAWTLLGGCEGTIAPTGSPTWDLPSGLGCPEPFDEDASYEEGDKVELQGVVLQCKSWPNSAWCGRTGYEPLGPNSDSAWTKLGTCTGTMAPTGSPTFDVLEDQSGCPEAFDDSVEYEGGDRVSVAIDADRSLVYVCAASPNDGYCNQYEPGHWSKLGWTVTGYCEGTIAPTGSPVFDPARDQFGCPEAFDEDAEYEASDKVSTPVTADTSLVWQCSSDVHEASYCNQQVPGNEFKQGWKLLGHCTGTVAPTASPAFDALTEVGDGCPDVYDEDATYEPSDTVAVFIPDDLNGARAVVYQCKSDVHMAQYCNAGVNFAPGTDNSAMGWSVIGSCDGTIAPTAAPIAFSGPCQWLNGTNTVDIDAWDTADLATYEKGTRVRKGGDVYKCKGYPFYLWCRNPAYEPGNANGIWADAWTAAGECAAV
eukprot:scaffold131_cov206-Alexandrium_tamarense.AAC.17